MVYLTSQLCKSKNVLHALKLPIIYTTESSHKVSAHSLTNKKVVPTNEQE